MGKKKFIDLKENDSVYCISMTECELREESGTCLRELKVSGTIRTTDGYSISIRTVGGTFFTAPANTTCSVSQENVQDEVNLTFEVYATTKEEVVEKAYELVEKKLKILGLIKNRVNLAETGLILAEAAFDVLDTSEEPSLEEFASMALG